MAQAVRAPQAVASEPKPLPFKLLAKIEDGDLQVSKRGVTLLIDPMSLQYLGGAEIDYKDDIDGAQFVIRNPNASTTCGCGSSFSV